MREVEPRGGAKEDGGGRGRVEREGLRGEQPRGKREQRERLGEELCARPQNPKHQPAALQRSVLLPVRPEGEEGAHPGHWREQQRRGVRPDGAKHRREPHRLQQPRRRQAADRIQAVRQQAGDEA